MAHGNPFELRAVSYELFHFHRSDDFLRNRQKLFYKYDIIWKYFNWNFYNKSYDMSSIFPEPLETLQLLVEITKKSIGFGEG